MAHPDFGLALMTRNCARGRSWSFKRESRLLKKPKPIVAIERADPAVAHSACRSGPEAAFAGLLGEDRFNRSTDQDGTMFTKSRIAISFAVILNAAAVPLSTDAFAKNSGPDRDRYATAQNGKGGCVQMDPYDRANAIRGKHPQPQGTPRRCIDDPASPGG
jgi:hypothetical protein